MASMPPFHGPDELRHSDRGDGVFLAAITFLAFANLTGPLSRIMRFLFAGPINEWPGPLRAIMTLAFYAPFISGGVYAVWKPVFFVAGRCADEYACGLYKKRKKCLTGVWLYDNINTIRKVGLKAHKINEGVCPYEEDRIHPPVWAVAVQLLCRCSG